MSRPVNLSQDVIGIESWVLSALFEEQEQLPDFCLATWGLSKSYSQAALVPVATDTSSRFENVGYTVNQTGMAFMRV